MLDSFQFFHKSFSWAISHSYVGLLKMVINKYQQWQFNRQYQEILQPEQQKMGN